MQESLGLKPDWFWEINLFLIKNSNISLESILSKILPVMGSKEIGRLFFNNCLSPFLKTGTTLAIFHSDWNFPEFLNKIWKEGSKVGKWIRHTISLCEYWAYHGHEMCLCQDF